LELLSLDLLEEFARVGCQCRATDPMVLARYYADFSPWEWYAVCYHPRIRSFFGMTREKRGGPPEWAWFSLAELESARARFTANGFQIWAPPANHKRDGATPPDNQYPLRVVRDPRWRAIPAKAAGLLPGGAP